MAADAAALFATVRREAGLTQTVLAQRAETSQAMVARYENGAASPTVRTLARLLRAAGRDLVITGLPTDQTEVPESMATVLRDHAAEIHAAAETVGASNVRIFGSVARGEETPQSPQAQHAQTCEVAQVTVTRVEPEVRAPAPRCPGHQGTGLPSATCAGTRRAE